MLISRKLVQRRGIGELAVFSLLAGRHQSAKSKESTKSIFTTGLYFLPDSATHISFYFKQHFFERLQIFRYSAYIGLPYNLEKLASKSRTQTSLGEMQLKGEWTGTNPSLVLGNTLRTNTNFRLWSLFYSTQQFLGRYAGIIQTVRSFSML